MKLQKISQSITPFAGISFVTEEFNNCDLAKLIDDHLGTRCLTGYQYSETFRAWFSIFLSGGDVAENISCHLREGLEAIPGNRVPSADTLLRGIKELAMGNETVVSSSGKQYWFNINLHMNRLNLNLLLLTKQLKKGKCYDYDYDNQLIAHEKYDARRTYKKNSGYFPGVATIGDKIVNVENRDGNIWTVHYGTGGSTPFVAQAQPFLNAEENESYMMQDVNQDGTFDIVRKKNSSVDVYLTRNSKLSAEYSDRLYNYLPSSSANVVGSSVAKNNYHSFLIGIYNEKVSKIYANRIDGKQRLLTGSANSNGVVQRNYYNQLNDEYDYSNPIPNIYTKGYGATFPNENFNGPIWVVSMQENHLNSTKIESQSYSYYNAVVNRQGLGFRGFEKVSVYDQIRGTISEKTINPLNYGIPVKDNNHFSEVTYSATASVASNKKLTIKVNSLTEYNKATGTSISKSYLYDSYNNVTKETVNLGGGVTTVTDLVYYNSSDIYFYMLGIPLSKTITSTRNGASWIDKEVFAYNANWQILSKITYTGANGSNKTGETKWRYNTHGNFVSIKSAPYDVTEFLGDSIVFDTQGRRVESTINMLGQKTTYSNYDKYGNARTVKDYKNRIITYEYDPWGRLISKKYPDGVTETTTASWGGTGLYTVSSTATGSPSTMTHYDALGRELRSGNLRFNGQWQYVDKAYDSKGRIDKVSMPFKGTSPTSWNTYIYDTYNRPTKLTEASGKTNTWNYSGLSVTVMKDSITTTQTKDASGALVSVTDPGGTITYALRPDGQPSSITAPGGVVTSFGYDAYGRQTSIADPSAGTQTFSDTYTAAGVLTRSVKDANDKTITSKYDKYGRVTGVYRPEFNTVYTYNDDGLLANETSSNSTSKTFTYDTYDRTKTVTETVPDNKYLQKTYTYSGGNLEKVEYASQNGVIESETFVYANGHNTEIKLGNTSIWKLTEENALGQPTKATTGTMNRTYAYTVYGMPTGRTAGSIQNSTYAFEVMSGNLKSRKDNIRNITETFGYDNLNRLTNTAGKTIVYSANGNITSIAGVASLEYGNSGKPYQVSMVTPTGGSVPIREQVVTYTSFQRPATLAENGYNTTFTYNAAGDRVKMHLTQGSTAVLTRYYIGGQYEMDAQSDSERLYLGGDAYSAPAVYVKEGISWKIYYICRDYLGSVTHVANADGSLKHEYSYDAWGRLRNPVTQVAYTPGSEPALFLGRGYTGHEHLPWFGLVNMNARLYDPALGRFLSPDPYVQMPGFTQNFNRYSYCLNNPLVYIDQDGESFILVAAIIGAWIGMGQAMINSDKSGWGLVGDMFKGALIGGAAGAAGAWAGGAVSGALHFGGFFGGAISGGAGGGLSGFIGGSGNAWLLQGADFGQGLSAGLIGGGIGLASGALLGGLSRGIADHRNGFDFWKGSKTMDFTGPSDLATNGNGNTSISPQDESLKEIISSEYDIREGDYKIRKITTEKPDGYKMNYDNGTYINPKNPNATVYGSSTYYTTGYSHIHISPYALDSYSYNVPFFRAVTGHEIIHSIHFSRFGTNIIESMSEAVAYRYSSMELIKGSGSSFNRYYGFKFHLNSFSHGLKGMDYQYLLLPF